MASSYKRYLAEKVFGEQEHVTYRALSRALKVHCNHAKRMLYDFHRLENAKKPNSVHATYIIIGVPEPELHAKRQARDRADDEVMQSSPYVGSQPDPVDSDEEEPIPVTAVRLVREEELSDVKGQFQTISSIFVYSVQPTSLPDLNVLADLRQTILSSESEDPLTSGPCYGMTQNKNVKRRVGGGPAPVTRPSEPAKPKVTKPAAPSQPVKKEEASQNEQPPKQEKPKAEAERPSRPASQQSMKPKGQPKATEKPSQLKRDNSSIFKAFAKAKPKQKKEEPTHTPAAEPEKKNELEDVLMGDDSEGEEDDLFLDSGAQSNDKSRKTRKEREDHLKKMMEDEDEDEDEGEEVDEDEGEDKDKGEDEDMPDAPAEPAEPENPTAAEETPADEKPKTVETTADSNGRRRRRGRRQVMKKKVARDKEGYLITQEEPAWESFSENEPEPPKKKPPVSVAKPTKAPSKGQGNIMSFFKKQ